MRRNKTIFEQSRAEQSRAEQSRAEQSRAEQSRAEQLDCFICVPENSDYHKQYTTGGRNNPSVCTAFLRFLCADANASEGKGGVGGNITVITLF